MSHFAYAREQKVYRKDEQGNQIPILNEEGKPTGEFETDTKIYTDTFNIDMVIRSFRADEEKLIVLLKDGHETTESTPELINPKKAPIMGNIREVKSRVWVQSEIVLKGDDIFKFHKALGV